MVFLILLKFRAVSWVIIQERLFLFNALRGKCVDASKNLTIRKMKGLGGDLKEFYT